MNHTEMNTDVLVIGAGPSGSVAAAILKKKGFDVLVLEKQVFPRFVIGESLLPGCMRSLEEAGFLPAIEAAGFQLKKGARFETGPVRCDFDFSQKFSEGWGWTWEVKRDKFDKILTDELEKNGVDVRFQSEVTDVHLNENGSSVTTFVNADKTISKVNAKFIVDASGYGRVLNRLFDLESEPGLPSRTALFSHVSNVKNMEGADRDQIIIASHGPGIWSWEIPFSDATSSVGIVGDKINDGLEGKSTDEKFQYWMKRLSKHNGRLDEANVLFTPKEISGYSAASSKYHGKGFVMAGNSFGFVDPIFSSGVTIATETGALAANLVTKELNGEKVDWDESYTKYVQRGIEVFKAFVEYWYDGTLEKIFYTSEDNPMLKSQICSILAGYVWDESNSLVRKYKRMPSLAHILTRSKK